MDIHRSFIATLECGSASGKKPISVDYLRTPELGWSGWLMRGNYSGVALQFRFDYVGHTDNRVHYVIRAAASTKDYPLARLGINHNGYLGFYQIAGVWDYWKVELQKALDGSNTFSFILRDHLGQRVGIRYMRSDGGVCNTPGRGVPLKVDFLTVADYGWETDIGLFKAKISEYVEMDPDLMWRIPNP